MYKKIIQIEDLKFGCRNIEYQELFAERGKFLVHLMRPQKIGAPNKFHISILNEGCFLAKNLTAEECNKKLRGLQELEKSFVACISEKIKHKSRNIEDECTINLNLQTISSLKEKNKILENEKAKIEAHNIALADECHALRKQYSRAAQFPSIDINSDLSLKSVALNITLQKLRSEQERMKKELKENLSMIDWLRRQLEFTVNEFTGQAKIATAQYLKILALKKENFELKTSMKSEIIYEECVKEMAESIF